MESFTLEWAAETLSARNTGALNATVTAVCTDTRQITPGALFVALQGDNTDGHRYVGQAFEKGAIAAVVSRELPGVAGTQLIVPDTLYALGELARRYRSQFAIPVVGVTGSVGKTSTKEMIAVILRTSYRTLANERNFNNEIGVPLTLFALEKTHEVAVLEMGMRGLGEIDRLAEIAQPTLGLITVIGYAHIARLGSQEKIAEAKSELFQRLPDNGVAVLPMHSPFRDYLISRVSDNVNLVTFSAESGYMADVAMTATPGRIMVNGQGYDLQLKVPGQHHLANALAALAVGVAVGVPVNVAIMALEMWQGAEGRMAVRDLPNGTTILDDCYNAGPESMTSALKTLAQTGTGRKVAILGDMKELGDFGPELHTALGEHVIEADVRLLITVGDLAHMIAEGAVTCAGQEGLSYPARHPFATTEEAAATILGLIQPGDVVLVKGSRAMGLEKIVATLTGEAEAHP